MAKTPKQALEDLLKLHTPKPSKLVVLLSGGAGISKSSIVHQLIEKLGIKPEQAQDIFLAQIQAEELAGMPYNDGGVMKWTIPSILKNKKFLFFDEPNMPGSKDKQAAMRQIILERRIHEYKIDDDCIIVMAMNPSADGYDVEDLDLPMRTRVVQWDIVASVPDWLEWAEKAGIHEATRAYIKLFPEMLYKEPKDGKMAPCPRAWALIDDMVKCGLRDLDSYKNILGIEAATQFLKFLDERFNRVLIGDLIISYEKVKPKIKKMSPGEMMDLVIQVASYINTTGINDESTKLLENLLPDLKGDTRMGLASKIDKKIMAELISKNKAIVDSLIQVTSQITGK